MCTLINFAKLTNYIDMKNALFGLQLHLLRVLALSCLIAVFGLGRTPDAYAVNRNPASDGRVTYVGRIDKSQSAVSFDWSSTYLRISFTGDMLSAVVSDNRQDYFNVWIDKEMCAEPDKVIRIVGDTVAVIVGREDHALLKHGKTHSAVIQKRTEGEQGTVTFREFVTSGDLVQAPSLSQRLIEFVGDSYTCGYGSENSVPEDRYTPETQNPSKTYAAVLARFFDADYITIAHSGKGVVRNYGDTAPGWFMPERYGQTFDMIRGTEWNGRDIRPSLTVIYLGTNDFSTQKQPSSASFVNGYLRLISAVKRNYGESHPILCVASKADPMLYDYVREAVAKCGFGNVECMAFSSGVHLDTDSELGADWHPNYRAHIKLAYAMIPYVSTMTGWDIPLKVVE